MKKSILLIAHVDHGKTTLSEAMAVALAEKGLSEKDVIIIDTDLSFEEVKKKFEEVYLEEKAKPIKLELKAYEPMSECFIDKPKKPRYNPKTGKTKYFLIITPNKNTNGRKNKRTGRSC